MARKKKKMRPSSGRSEAYKKQRALASEAETSVGGAMDRLGYSPYLKATKRTAYVRCTWEMPCVPYEGVPKPLTVHPSDYLWDSSSYRSGTCINLEPMKNLDEAKRIENLARYMAGVATDISEKICAHVLSAYARIYWKTRREFWNVFMVLCAAQRDEGCQDTFAKVPIELLAVIASVAEQKTLEEMACDPVRGLPSLASRLFSAEGEKMIYSVDCTPSQRIDQWEMFVSICVRVYTPSGMEAHHMIKEVCEYV